MDAHKEAVSPYLRFLFGLPKGHIFTTRDLLPFARRTTIDSALSRMVRGGLLERLTRGVFRFYDSNNKKVSVKQIAAIKRKAFGRKVATVANNIRRDCLPRLDDRGREKLRPSQETHVTDGRTSSFLMHTNGWRINLKSVSPRILALGESVAGRAMRDLWLIGNKDITLLDIQEVWEDLKPRDKAQIPALKKLLPQWLTEILPKTPSQALEALMIRPPRRPIFIKPRKKADDSDAEIAKSGAEKDSREVETENGEFKTSKEETKQSEPENMKTEHMKAEHMKIEHLKTELTEHSEDKKEDEEKEEGEGEGNEEEVEVEVEEEGEGEGDDDDDDGLDDYDCH